MAKIEQAIWLAGRTAHLGPKFTEMNGTLC